MNLDPRAPDWTMTVRGAPLPEALAHRVTEIVVDTSVLLPSTCALRIEAEATAPGDVLDAPALALGADVEVRLRDRNERQERVFSGRIAALEAELGPAGCSLTVRAYDHSHQMDRLRRTETYQSMSCTDIARKVIARSGLSPGTLDAAGGPLPFVQQRNETDWRFLRRLAADVGFDVVADDRKVHFRRAGAGAAARTVQLVLGETLRSFRPRLTGVQQVREVVVRGWDPKTKRAVVGSAKNPVPTSTVGLQHAQVVGAMGGGAVTVVDRPVTTQAEATALAESVAGRLVGAFVAAEGVTEGDPWVVAGTKVEVRGIGTRFSGTYVLTAARHIVRRRSGYEVRFEVTGRTPPALSPAGHGTPTARRGTIAVGVVTNNEDPDGLGRVRVNCPELGEKHEGWWARITAPSAGAGRGLLMLPVPNDEVLLAFEHDDDEHPYVIGAVWNGRDRPQALVHPDGSFHLASDQQLLMDAKKAITVTGQDAVSVSAQKDLTLDATGKLVEHAKGDATVRSDGAAAFEGTRGVTVKTAAAGVVEAGASLRLKGATVEVTGDGQVMVRGAAVTVQASGALRLSAPQVLLG